jgi:hypothetical protein
VFDRKFREEHLDDSTKDKSLAIMRYNYDDDTFEVVRPLKNYDQDWVDPGEEGEVKAQSEDVAMVERILG